jgi:hypothetical protein
MPCNCLLELGISVNNLKGIVLFLLALLAALLEESSSTSKSGLILYTPLAYSFCPPQLSPSLSWSTKPTTSSANQSFQPNDRPFISPTKKQSCISDWKSFPVRSSITHWQWLPKTLCPPIGPTDSANRQLAPVCRSPCQDSDAAAAKMACLLHH